MTEISSATRGECNDEPRSFTSTAIRDGRRWSVRCDQYPHVQSSVTLLAQAAEHQRFGIASHLDIPPELVRVRIRPVLPMQAEDHMTRARELRETAASASKTAATETRAAARILAEFGLSLRDIGTIFGVTYQRAHQLVAAGISAGDAGGGEHDER